jgi:NTE family protein
MSARVTPNTRARKSHRQLARPPFECIALLLQGGGALGAYQAGVYEALSEADLAPDWVAGISIGAVNAALIAGNPPTARVDSGPVTTGLRAWRPLHMASSTCTSEQ